MNLIIGGEKLMIKIGLDLVNEKFDYTKTWEENWQKYKEDYKKVYGEDPDDLKSE